MSGEEEFNEIDRKALVEEVATYRHGRVPRELRRRQVLAEAHDLFVERGYAGASMDELARRVGVSKPVIYDLVGSKEQLFQDTMARINEELRACVGSAVMAESDISRKLYAGILAFFRFVQQHQTAWTVLLSTDVGLAATELASLRRHQTVLVATLITAGAESFAEPAETRTAEALAHAINGAAEFVALWWRDHPEIPAEALAQFLTKAFSQDLFKLSTQSLTRKPE